MKKKWCARTLELEVGRRLAILSTRNVFFYRLLLSFGKVPDCFPFPTLLRENGALRLCSTAKFFVLFSRRCFHISYNIARVVCSKSSEVERAALRDQ